MKNKDVQEMINIMDNCKNISPTICRGKLCVECFAEKLYAANYRKMPFYNPKGKYYTITEEMFNNINVIIGARGSGRTHHELLIAEKVSKLWIKKIEEVLSKIEYVFDLDAFLTEMKEFSKHFMEE